MRGTSHQGGFDSLRAGALLPAMKAPLLGLIVLPMWQQRWLLLTPGFQTLLESPASGGEGLSSWVNTVSSRWHSLALPCHALTLLPGESGLCDWQAHQV